MKAQRTHFRQAIKVPVQREESTVLDQRMGGDEAVGRSDSQPDPAATGREISRFVMRCAVREEQRKRGRKAYQAIKLLRRTSTREQLLQHYARHGNDFIGLEEPLKFLNFRRRWMNSRRATFMVSRFVRSLPTDRASSSS